MRWPWKPRPSFAQALAVELAREDWLAMKRAAGEDPTVPATEPDHPEADEDAVTLIPPDAE